MNIEHVHIIVSPLHKSYALHLPKKTFFTLIVEHYEPASTHVYKIFYLHKYYPNHTSDSNQITLALHDKKYEPPPQVDQILQLDLIVSFSKYSSYLQKKD